MTRLVILGLLRTKPMHGYEIQSIIQESKMNRWSNLLAGSIYHALNKLEAEGLICTEAEERTGARLRKIYAITSSGEAAFMQLLKESLSLPPHSPKSDFSLALGWIHLMPADESVPLLQENIARLEETYHQWEVGRSIKAQYSPSPILELGFQNALDVIQMDIDYLNKLVTLIQEGA